MRIIRLTQNEGESGFGGGNIELNTLCIQSSKFALKRDGRLFQGFPKRLIYLSNWDIRIYVALRPAREQVLSIISPLADFLVPRQPTILFTRTSCENAVRRGTARQTLSKRSFELVYWAMFYAVFFPHRAEILSTSRRMRRVSLSETSCLSQLRGNIKIIRAELFFKSVKSYRFTILLIDYSLLY